MNVFDVECIVVCEVFGYCVLYFLFVDYYVIDGDEWMYGCGVYGKLIDSGDWCEKIDLCVYCYMFEDIWFGLLFIVLCGCWVGVLMFVV